MAGSILASLLSRSKFVVTNAATGDVVLSGLKIKRVDIQLISRVPRHMREDGTTISDTRIIEPSIVTARVICPTINDVEAVISVMNDRQNLYTIKSKGIVMNNMMVHATSTEQSAEMLSAAPFQITFRELLQETANPAACAQAADSDSQNQGIQIAPVSPSNVANLFTTVSNNINNAISKIAGSFGG